jgi:tRNA-dihydrouridine synthase
LPGQIARYLAGGRREKDPAVAEQLDLVSALYDAMLSHHGVDVGVRHARKHLGWALDTAAATLGASPDLLKFQRSRVLTAVEPSIVRRRLAEAFDALGTAAAWRDAA